MKPIFIVGYMACGKTTLGRALARKLGCEFIDLDFRIEQRFRKSVSEIFHNQGEEEFRRLEGAMLREVGEFEDVVVSCGGGTPCFGSNMEYMNSRGLTVWLKTGVECIVRRLLAARKDRPLTKGKGHEELLAFVERHIGERKPYYGLAQLCFPGEELETRDEIARSADRLASKIKN